MDSTRFDRVTIVIGQRTSRCTVLGLLAALGLTELVTEEAGAVVCLASGERWRGGRGTCCSGICN